MEVVFRLDWKYTRVMIGDEVEGATFLTPGLEDESEDWGARGVLLEKYRALLALMKARGIDPKLPAVWANLQMIDALGGKKGPNQPPEPMSGLSPGHGSS